jgi:hypothetical protein
MDLTGMKPGEERYHNITHPVTQEVLSCEYIYISFDGRIYRTIHKDLRTCRTQKTRWLKGQLRPGAVVLSIRLEPKINKKLEEMAGNFDVSKSQLINRLIENFSR